MGAMPRGRSQQCMKALPPGIKGGLGLGEPTRILERVSTVGKRCIVSHVDPFGMDHLKIMFSFSK